MLEALKFIQVKLNLLNYNIKNFKEVGSTQELP